MTSTEVQPYLEDDGSIIGIDEIDAGDLITPRLSIDHNDGVWKSNLSDERLGSFTAILLTRVKQRIKWKAKLEDNAEPQCKSNDFNVGFPNNGGETTKAADLFPWAESVFQKENYPPDPAYNNLSVLPCSACSFKDWNGDDKPGCKELWTFAALVYMNTPTGPEWRPVLLTIQGTSISSIRPYISDFITQRKALFTAMTSVSLKEEFKSGNKYYVAVFTGAGPTSDALRAGYIEQTKTFQKYLKQMPRNTATEAITTGEATPAAPQIAPPAPPPPAPPVNEAPAAPAPAPAVAPAMPPAPPMAPPPPAMAPAEPVQPPVSEIVDAEVVAEPVVASPAPPVAAAPIPATPPAPPAPAAPAPPAPTPPAPAPPTPEPAAAAGPSPVGPGKLPF